ncbi:hypothetical protein [Aminobacter ciceronei]|uniref:Transglycosylase SLT domain-containing protein n=1 Tax=Aminobacter ciceronei TaxID=150723 RepID=A0ABR6CGT3_9HYPH|nr:hypothetical protein [Aminobacter ciceronei]MBA8910144.1 hypothetical protein [Aminobacter ciceronei]MBA9023916.1 hypothetical protein [Aminobacter ciceronei]
MVNIPTARDVAYNNPRSGRIANSGPTPMVGAAMQDAGQAVVRASYNLLDLADREKIDVANDRSNAVSTSLTRFLADEEQRFLKAREESSESGIGFTRQFMEGHQQRANDFAKANFEGLTKDAQTGYLNNILSRGNALFEKANNFENTTKSAYYDRTTNTNLSTYRTQIQNNAASFEDLKRQGLEAINSANMPEPWKAERRQKWEADAAESKWRWKFQQDPQTAIRDIKGIKVDTKGLAGAIQQTAEQLGIDPVDLATVMSYETGGTFDPWIKGPTTKWGTHRGLIQWGEPQAAKYGVTKDMPIEQQVAAAGQYLRDAGVKPGMGLIDIYSAINAGAPGRYDRSDYKAGGAPGTVADKVKFQMEGHKQKAAALLGGTYTPATGDPDLDAIPHDRRDQLASWGETEYSQQVTQERAAAKDNYSLLIKTEPDQVRESVILADTTLDNGDKAELIGALRTAQKDSGDVNAMIKAMASGDVSVNSFDNDQTKVADKTYDQLIARAEDADQQQAITSDFIDRTKYIPKTVQAMVRQGVASTDPATFAKAMSAADAVERIAPISFGAFEGGAQARDKLAVFRHLVNDRGLSGEEAATRIIAMADPAVKAKREVLKPELQKFVKDLTVADVTAMYDPSIFTSEPGAGIIPDHPVGLLTEYREIAEEKFYEMGGDAGSAKAAALADLKTRWNVSNISGKPNLMRMPPELHYPAIGDTQDYLREDAMKTASDYAAKFGRKVENVAILASDKTRADIEAGGVKAGRPPRYRLFYQYTEGGQVQYDEVLGPPWGVTPATIKELSDKAAGEAKERFLATRGRNDAANDAERAGEAAAARALDETVGPDWMKARAAEGARELGRSEAATIRRQPSDVPAAPGPIIDPKTLPDSPGMARKRTIDKAVWGDDAAD